MLAVCSLPMYLGLLVNKVLYLITTIHLFYKINHLDWCTIINRPHYIHKSLLPFNSNLTLIKWNSNPNTTTSHRKFFRAIKTVVSWRPKIKLTALHNLLKISFRPHVMTSGLATEPQETRKVATCVLRSNLYMLNRCDIENLMGLKAQMLEQRETIQLNEELIVVMANE